MHAKYGQAIDRDSAYEMLNRKLEAGAQAAEAEARAQAEAEADERDRFERESRPSTTRRSTRAEKSVVEQVVSSSAFKQFARSAGRQFVRSIFGTGRRR